MTPSATANDAAPERLGEVLAGKYRIVRLLGEGGMGRVYEAEHTTVGRRFAVKLLRPHLAANEQALARFRREARAAGALENEHIAAVLDFDTASDGAPFLVMEYLEGRSLGQLLAEEGPLPVTRAANALLQVCRGLEAAHAAGILHRDLKPDNLFVTRRADGSELLKILDFGIAKLLNEGGRDAPIQTGAAIGTPYYMAPEQVRGDVPLDERVDLYALGVIFYELLSGQKPHPGDSGNAVLAHVLTESPVRLEKLRPGLPSGMAELVHRALAFDPRDRPPSARAFARELESLLPPEVMRERGQLELRSARASSSAATPSDVRATAPTLPTPDSSAVSSGTEAPGAHSRDRTWLGIAATLLVAAGAAFALRSASRTESPATPLPAAPSVPSPTMALPEPTAPAASSVASAIPAAPPPPSATGRPRGRPTSTRSKPSSASVPAPDTASVGVSAPAGSAGRIRFDSRNPYE